jgi:hypothetical protein
LLKSQETDADSGTGNLKNIKQIRQSTYKGKLIKITVLNRNFKRKNGME